MKRKLKISAIILFSFVVLVNLFFVKYDIVSNSMSPTIKKGDSVVAYRWAYIFSDPAPQDVVVFKPVKDVCHEDWIHRIIAMPGDQVNIKNNQVTVNGLLANFPNTIKYQTANIDVPDDYFYQKGDSSNSIDGIVHKKYVKRKVVLIINKDK